MGFEVPHLPASQDPYTFFSRKSKRTKIYPIQETREANIRTPRTLQHHGIHDPKGSYVPSRPYAAYCGIRGLSGAAELSKESSLGTKARGMVWVDTDQRTRGNREQGHPKEGGLNPVFITPPKVLRYGVGCKTQVKNA